MSIEQGLGNDHETKGKVINFGDHEVRELSGKEQDGDKFGKLELEIMSKQKELTELINMRNELAKKLNIEQMAA